jgi:hypothetical protein
MDYFSTHELFRASDHSVPVQTEHAIRGLMAPLESLFPDSRMPRDRQAALQCLDLKRHPDQPFVSVAKKDWIEWILWEVQLRLAMAVRFLTLRDRIGSEKDPPPMVLFLREFRVVHHTNVGGGIGFDMMMGGPDADVELRERIEKIFSDCLVFWIGNPKDALSYSFSKQVPANSYPYLASKDWLRCVRTMAKSANLIVMANTGRTRDTSKSEKGVTQELELLRKAGLLGKSFFSNPGELGPRTRRARNVEELTRDHLSGTQSGRYKDILRLRPMEHWAGHESSTYAANYVGAIDQFWGDIQDTGRKVTGDVFAALFMALSVLLLFRGELAGAAELQRALVVLMQRSPDLFHPVDRMAEGALHESATWCGANAKLFGGAYGIRFAERP